MIVGDDGYLSKMFQISVQTQFCAAHALSIAGAREPIHGHNWDVTAVIAGDRLDSDGLLCDFHTVHAVLDEIVQPFHNNNLNTTKPFDEVNPSAELVAKHIAVELQRLLGESLAPHAKVASVRVTEAAGCAATYLT